MLEENTSLDMRLRYGKFFYIAYLGLLLACAIVVFGVYQIVFGTIYDQDGNILTLQDQIGFFIPFVMVGFTWLFSIFQMTLKRIRSPYAFEIRDDGFHHMMSGGILLAFVGLINISFIPFEHIIYDDSGLMPQFKIKKEYMSSYGFVTRLLLKFKGLKITLLYAKLDESFAIFLKEKFKDPLEYRDLDHQND
ncbi:MAG: hypothetical protein RBT45_04485 [Acholeplasmataceae bacterium]|jgi:hypothetical protein|nr:hypothetical protein [Acholeplasmataceae bacterium]